MNVDTRTRSQKISDSVCRASGSWSFIIVSALFITVWIAWFRHWDPYPFILLNGLITVVELFQAPLILMAENRQQERDSENIQKILEAIHEMKNK